MTDHENIIFYEISKGADGYAYISDYDSMAITMAGEEIGFLDGCVKADKLSATANLKNRPYPPDGNLRWSTAAQDGKNLYVLRIDKNMNAYFADYDPVVCFSPHLPATLKPIEDAKTHKKNNRWATFAVDTKKIHAGIEQFGEKLRHEHTCHHQVSLPLYLNIIDDETGLPAMLAANHHHNVTHSHSHFKEAAAPFAHRGPHFTSFVSMMYVSCPE